MANLTTSEPSSLIAPSLDSQPKKLYIETVGCQMNVLDSELVTAKLREEGYELTEDIRQADTILYNTCSVRQHAEDKVYSALGRVRRLKEKNPELSIGVLGCMAQKDQKKILQRAPHVDVVIGPGQLEQISDLLNKSKDEGKPQMAVSLPRTAGSRDKVTASFAEYDPTRQARARSSQFQAFVRIMMGCDKFCTYCIVPSVRGPEQSRHPEEILSEARALADQGVKEITLLGQTVNSYKYREPGQTTRLSDLLVQLDAISGLQRVKFITNYPNDMTDDLLQAIRDLPKVSRYLHVPAQSGCNLMLKRMKRGYTVELYDEMLDRIRNTIPGASVSSDFIVGFSGETEESFQKSMDMVRRSRFKNSFIFKYSPREGTKAADLMEDDIPDEVKKRRNHELLALQNAISLEDNQGFIGQTVEVLVEGLSKSASKSSLDQAENDNGNHVHGMNQYTGRTWCDRIVVFDGRERLVGSFANVKIREASAVTLFGDIAIQLSDSSPNRD